MHLPREPNGPFRGTRSIRQLSNLSDRKWAMHRFLSGDSQLAECALHSVRVAEKAVNGRFPLGIFVFEYAMQQ